MAELFKLPARATNANGIPLSGAKAYFYATGTLTPATIYSDAALATPRTNPVVADSGGNFPATYLDPTVIYRLIVTSSDGATTLFDLDPYNGDDLALDLALPEGAGSIGFSHAETYAAGTVGIKFQQNRNPMDAPYNAAGDGTTNDRTALVNADAAGPIVITANHRVSSNMTFFNTVLFVGNGRLTIDAGVTVTFTNDYNHQPVAGDLRIFYGAGTVSGLKFFNAAWIAEGDGVTDDTTGLQRALTCLGAVGGGTLHLPARTWKITAALTVSSPNIRVAGSGRRATVIKQFTASAGVFSVTSQYFTLSTLSIEYNAQGTAGGIAVLHTASFYSTMEDVYIYKAYVGTKYTAAANSHKIASVNFEDCTVNGVLVENAVNVSYVQGQILNSNTSTLCTLGCIRLYGAVEGCNFVDVATYQGVYALTTGADAFTAGAIPAYNKFDACYFDAASGGSLIDSTVEADFDNCWFSARPANGATITNSDGVRFTGGNAVNCGQHGVLVEASAVRVVFKGFTSRDNSVSAANTYNGIMIAAGATDFIVQGCTLTSAFLGFGTQKYGVEVQIGGSDRYVVKNNLIGGNGTGGVADGGTGVNKAVGENY